MQKSRPYLAPQNMHGGWKNAKKMKITVALDSPSSLLYKRASVAEAREQAKTHLAFLKISNAGLEFLLGVFIMQAGT